MLETSLSAQGACDDVLADGARVYEMFLENIVLPCRIGVHDSEHGAPQRVRIDLVLEVCQDRACFTDDIADALSYDEVMAGLKRLTLDEHTMLVERLAEKIAAMCLKHHQVQRARVSVAKLDVYPGIGVPGIRIDRHRAGTGPAHQRLPPKPLSIVAARA